MLRTLSLVSTSLGLVVALVAQPAQDPTRAERMFNAIPAGLELLGPVVFAPDGSTVAYRGPRGDKCVPVIDGKLGEPFDFVDPPLFGPTGDHLVFRVSERTSKKAEKWRLLRNGAAIAESEWIGPPAWSPDGSKLAYWTHPGAKLNAKGERTGGALVFVVDGKKGSKWEACDEASAPVWSADSKHVATIAKKGDTWCVLLDGESVGEAPVMRDSEPDLDAPPAPRSAPTVRDVALSKDATHVAFAAFTTVDGEDISTAWRVVYDKTVLRGDYETAGLPTFSPDGERFAYVVSAKGKGQGVVLDFKAPRFEEVGEIGEPVFSPNGKRLAYPLVRARGPAASDDLSRALVRAKLGGKWTVVLDGNPEDRSWDEVRDLTFSPDSKRLAFRARDGDSWHVSCGRWGMGGAGDMGPPSFSDDGSLIRYGVRNKNTLAWFAVSSK